MFNLFKNITISQRLKYLQYMIIFGLIFVGGANFVSGIIADKVQGAVYLGMDTSALTRSVASEVQKALHIEKTFVITKDEALIKKYNASMSEIDRLMEAINQNVVDATGEDSEGVALPYIAKLKADFDASVKGYVELGLSPSLGSQGRLRSAVHELESVLEQINIPEMTISLLSMRRHEKDFLLRGDISYQEELVAESYRFKVLAESSPLPPSIRTSLLGLVETYVTEFRSFVKISKQVVELDNQLAQSEVQLEEIVAGALIEIDVFSNDFRALAVKVDFITKITLYPLLALIILASGLALYRTTRTITGSLNQLGETVREVSSGNYAARSLLTNSDELGEFGRALDDLLDDRVSTLADIEKENEQLNNSVIDLMESVADMASRDLTIRANVAEDVTGPVADAINMLTGDTSKVLSDIRDTAIQVELVAKSVQSQSSKVSDVAEQERMLVDMTLEKLKQSSEAMNSIAEFSIRAKEIADQTTSITNEALNSVGQTAEGMSEIRSSVSEAEKRIKRLGERSLEISGVVEIINNIAERTHVLALNASMQAAAAGDAGRGFAVVAEEVQRLAESSRRSTSEISELVTNIQSETAEAMATMNLTISQVVSGTKLAEQSANHMVSAQQTTVNLAESVSNIAEHSQIQSSFSDALMVEAAEIVTSTQVTGKELETQATQSENLVEFSVKLLSFVNVFKLQS